MIVATAANLKVVEKTSHSSRTIVSWSDLVEEQVSKKGLSKIQAVEKIRSLIDDGIIFPIEDSPLISFRLHKQTSDFEQRQQRLQQAWLLAKEMDALQVFRDEVRALRRQEQKREEVKTTK